MSKYKVVNLIDKLFVSVTIFLILFAWINFYLRQLWLTLFLSLILSGIIVFLIYFFQNKKQFKEIARQQNATKINDTYLHFKLTPRKDKLKLLNKILSLNYDTNLTQEILSYKKENENHLLIIATHLTKITQNDVYNLVENFQNLNYPIIEIIGEEFDSNINTKIFKNKKIVLINKTKLYLEYFEKSNTYPEENNIEKNLNKLRLKDIMKSMFKKERSKSYFFCGLILIFSSIILPFNAYYVVMGSMLLSFSLISRIYPNFRSHD